MLQSYLFVPSHNIKFIKRMASLKPDHFILDLEESVSTSDLDVAMSNLRKIAYKNLYFVRPEFVQNGDSIDTCCFVKLLALGYRKFLLPKIKNITQLEIIEAAFHDSGIHNKKECEFILLVENPSILMNLNDAIANRMLNITGIALGSHDYCSEIGACHTQENIFFARNYILNVAKAYGLQAIDTASVEISNLADFDKECISSFNMGFDAKVAIHPSQVEIMKSANYFSEEEIEEAIKVMKIKSGIPEDSYSLINLNGKVFEKPHLKRINKILEWYEKKGVDHGTC